MSKRKAGDDHSDEPLAPFDASIAKTMRAAHFAALKHVKQRRKGGDGDVPYINHPVGVAHILANEGGVTDAAVLQAALLHDAVEDTATTAEELEREFGVEVAALVADVTDDKSLPKAARKRAQIAHAVHCLPKAKLVKLADKIYNCRDLARGATPSHWSAARTRGYFAWSAVVVNQLRGTNARLEAAFDAVLDEAGVRFGDDLQATVDAYIESLEGVKDQD